MQSNLGNFQLQKPQLPDLSGRVALMTGVHSELGPSQASFSYKQLVNIGGITAMAMRYLAPWLFQERGSS